MHARRIEPSLLTATDWKRARPHLLAAVELAGGTHDEADLIEGIGRSAYHLWLGDDSAILSEIVHYPRLKSHRLFLAGGDLAELMLMEPELATEARLIGCGRHEIIGRKGWERTLKGLGYGHAATALRRSI